MFRTLATRTIPGLLVLLLVSAPAPAQPADVGRITRANAEADAVTARQSVDAFCSIQDGQPGGAGKIEGEIDTGWETGAGGGDAALQTGQIKYTPDASGLLRGTQLVVSTTAVMGLGRVTGNGDVSLGWSQRWVTQRGRIPTLSTIAGVRAPTGDRSSGVDGTLTGVIAEDAGPLTLYLNGSATTANGNVIPHHRPFQGSLLAGAKWRLREREALVVDYLWASSVQRGHDGMNVLEFAWQHDFRSGPTVGPGIVIGLDRHEETPAFGAGLRVVFAF